MSRRRPRRARTGTGAPTLIVPREQWPLRGACVVPSTAPVEDAREMWDSFDEPTTDPRRLAMVRGICAVCPVLAECREFGMTQRHGFFGGLTPEERAARAVGDVRPHEQLVAEASELGRSWRPGSGGDRRGPGWHASRAEALTALVEGQS